jgi:CBS domain-containing protein
VVVEEAGGVRRPVGLITDRDVVVEVVAEGVACDSVTVDDVMARDLLTADEGDELLDTLHRMRERGVRRLPVLGDQGALVGILAVDDLVDLLAEQLADIVALVGREVRHERDRRSG